jgi:hypothetical protein
MAIAVSETQLAAPPLDRSGRDSGSPPCSGAMARFGIAPSMGRTGHCRTGVRKGWRESALGGEVGNRRPTSAHSGRSEANAAAPP